MVPVKPRGSFSDLNCFRMKVNVARIFAADLNVERLLLALQIAVRHQKAKFENSIEFANFSRFFICRFF